MTTIRVLPKGAMFQVVETDGAARTLSIRTFPTMEAARKWARSRTNASPDSPPEAVDAYFAGGGTITVESFLP
jgi:hypothetical protein